MQGKDDITITSVKQCKLPRTHVAKEMNKRHFKRNDGKAGSINISIGVAAIHPGIVIDPWPMSKSTKVGFQPCLADQLRSILESVNLPFQQQSPLGPEPPKSTMT